MRKLRTLLLLVAMVLFATPAFAQLANTDTAAPDDYAGGGGAQVTVTMTATLGNAVSLTIDGATGTTITPSGGATGDVVFGAFDTVCSSAPTTGDCVRTTAGSAGAHLVAGFTATVAFSGAASADLSITRNAAYAAGGPPYDVAAADLKFQTGLGNAWTDSGDGAALPDPVSGGVGGDEDNLGAALASGDTVDHEVAMFFADTATAGDYETTIRWTATTN